jgi:hypothetical protein
MATRADKQATTAWIRKRSTRDRLSARALHDASMWGRNPLPCTLLLLAERSIWSAESMPCDFISSSFHRRRGENPHGVQDSTRRRFIACEVSACYEYPPAIEILSRSDRQPRSTCPSGFALTRHHELGKLTCDTSRTIQGNGRRLQRA